MFKRSSGLAAACSFLCLCGCGKATATVSGSVSLDGKPVKYGSVLLVTEDRSSFSIPIQPDGTYKFEKVPFGTARVAVNSPDPREVEGPAAFTAPDRAKALAKGPKAAPVDSKGWFPIPDLYNRPDRSGLSLTVDNVNTTFDIRMKSQPKVP
jgi:hypothetical protein